MNVTYSYPNGGKPCKLQTDLPDDESSVMEAAGKLLLDSIDVPSDLKIHTSLGDAWFCVNKRGTFVDKDGYSKPSIHVTCEDYDIRLPHSTYKKAALICVNGRKDKETGEHANNYKMYVLDPLADGNGSTAEVDAYYGRCDSFFDPNYAGRFGKRKVQVPYEPYMYWLIYYEKLSKGYVDQTDELYGKLRKRKSEAEQKVETPVVQTDASPSAILYDTLYRDAKRLVSRSFISDHISDKQVHDARKALNLMMQRKTVAGFNRQMERLAMLIPRSVYQVSDLFASSKDDFADIISREETLLNAMDTVSVGTTGENFGQFGISVFEATVEQRQHVLDKLPVHLQNHVVKIYRVIDKHQKEKFDSYRHRHGIHVIKELWHGSRNENWFSIVKNSLQLHPDAIITGKMFGNGIYFAPSPSKSWNYTSYFGTRWAGGKSDHAYMGLFAVAYGTPWDIQSYSDIRHYTESELRKNHKDCVHAHAGQILHADEIIFYNEAAILMNYIVEFK